MDEVIQRFEHAGARYLLIGGQAMRLEGMPRFTMDWDFFVADDTDNIQRINDALADILDLPLVPRGPQGENLIQTYQTRWGVLQFHLAVPGLSRFNEVYSRRVSRPAENDTTINCLDTRDLLASKEATARSSDQLDIEFLRAKLDGNG